MVNNQTYQYKLLYNFFICPVEAFLNTSEQYYILIGSQESHDYLIFYAFYIFICCMFVSCGIKCRMQIVEWKCNTSCGDGFRAGFEECDDGNVVDSDGCRCEIEFGVESAHCLAM